MQLNARLSRLTPRALVLTALIISGMLLITGCSSWLDSLTGETAAPTPTKQSETAVAEPTETPEPVDPIPGVKTITLWVPPQFSPQSETAAGNLLQDRLDEFMEANPGVIVVTRIKGASGHGGLLEALTTSAAAAPDAMPSIIALNRSDLEQAALKSLVLPLDGITLAADDKDWYPYARELGRVQNSTFGIPFAGDALVLVYRTDETAPVTLDTWDDVFAKNEVVIAPLDDSQALVTLALYRSAGGAIKDSEGRPALDAEILSQVLTHYSTGMDQGAFPNWLIQLQTNGQAWQAFSESRGDMVITWSSNYLADSPEDASATALPPLGSNSYTMATGWSWALADNDSLTRDTSIELIEYLSESEFLTEWTAAVGYLPTKGTVMDGWPDQTLQPTFDRVLSTAEVRPANELLASLGPVLRESVLAIFNGLAEPEQAAQSAAEKLGTP